LTKREELSLFLERCDELIDSKYIIADIKLANMLKAVASSETLLALFKNCLVDFDYEQAQKKYLVKSPYLSADKGEFVLPPNSREILAFIFSLLVEIDAKNIDLSTFINKYFYAHGSFSSGYDAFITGMIKPFKNTVKMIVESVLDGKIQDPIEALIEQEKRLERESQEKEEQARKEKEFLKKTYGLSIKQIKELLLSDKQKIKSKKFEEDKKEEIFLIIDMLASVIESEDKDAIIYAFVAYKYLAKSHKLLFFGRVKKISQLIKVIVNEL